MTAEKTSTSHNEAQSPTSPALHDGGDAVSARVRTVLARHRLVTSGAVLGTAAIVLFVLVWFQPQKLVLDERVDEAAPAQVAPPPVPTGATPTPTAPGGGTGTQMRTLAAGSFRSLEHATSGRALVVRLAGGSRLLRFEDLNTSNGPDLRVHLSPVGSNAGVRGYRDHFVDLGRLKGNVGNQNYELPSDLDLSAFRSAVIWCRRFSVAFGVAPLETA